MRRPIEAPRLAVSVICSSLIALAAAPGACLAAGQAQLPAANAARLALDRQVQGRAIMMKMAQLLAGAPHFRVNLHMAYDAVQQSGQKVEFHESRTVLVSRPDRLRIDGTRSDGEQALTVFTGKDVVLVDHASMVYATAPQPGTLDDTIVYFVRDLGMRLPLAFMLLGRLPAELQERVRSVEYVELSSIDGAASHHIAARGDTVDMQMWVADGAQALPQRVVLTYKTAPGQPQFRSEFSAWDLAPEISAAMFEKPTPDGLQKVAFAAQLPRVAPAAAASAAKQGAR